MRAKTLLGGALAAVALAVSLTAPASATERANVSLQECISRHDFTEFFRNNSGEDKYCYDSAGAADVVEIDLNHVTWFHAGVNSGWFDFLDGADGQWKTHFFGPGDDTGCTDCAVSLVHLDR